MKNTLKFSKKALSFLLVLSMIFSSTALTAFAALDWTQDPLDLGNTEILKEGTSEENMPYLETVLIEERDGGYTEDVTKKDFQVGDTVIVAIKAHNFSQFTNYEKGLKQITTGLVYDTTYLQQSFSSKDFANNVKTALNTAGNNSVYNKGNDNEWYIVDENNSKRQADLEPEGEAIAETSTLGSGSTLKKTVITVASKVEDSHEGDANLQLELVDEGSYVAIYKFTVNAVPEDGSFSAGVSLSRSKSIVVALGAGSQFNKTYTANDGLHKYLKLVDNVNLWPPTYTVEFYNDKDAATGAVPGTEKAIISDIESGKSIEDMSRSAEIPTEDKFEAPAGQVFAGFQYDDTVGMANDFDENTIIPQDNMFSDDDTTLEVYATYEDGNTITYNSNYQGKGEMSDDVTKEYTIKKNTAIGEDNIPAVGGEEPDIAIPPGFSFKGWSKDQNGGDQILSNEALAAVNPVESDATYYAIWEENITVTLNANYNSADPEKATITGKPNVALDGGAVDTAVGQITRANYKVKSWNNEPNGSGDTDYTTEELKSQLFSESTDLYAIWEAEGEEQATLTFDSGLAGNDVTFNPSSITVNKGDNVYDYNLPDTEGFENYDFVGWYKSPAIDSEDKVEDFETGHTVSDNETVYAHWEYKGADKVTLNFMKNQSDPDNVPYATVVVKSGTTLGDAMPADPTKPNAAFSKWTVDKEGTDDEFTKDTQITADESTPNEKTVYAQYVDEVTIKYDLNEHGKGSAPDSKTGIPTASYADPTSPEDDTYDFISWNTKQNGSGTDIDDDTYQTFGAVAERAKADGADTENGVTLYAQWGYVLGPQITDDDAIEVIFDSNCKNATADAKPDKKTLKKGDKIGESNMPTPPERENYTFVGWYTNVDGNDPLKVDGNTQFDEGNFGSVWVEKSVPENETYIYHEVTLYAKWTVAESQEGNTAKLTFIPNTGRDGTGGTNITKEIVKNDSLGYVPAAPTDADEHLVFEGWYEGTVAGGEGQKYVEFTGDKFDGSTPISEDKTYYAKWKRQLVATAITDEPIIYTGEAQKVTYKITTIVPGSEDNTPDNDVIFTGALPNDSSDYEIKFFKADDDAKTPVQFKDAGEYGAEVTIKNTALGAKRGDIIALTTPALTIEAATLYVTVNPETQEVKKKDAAGKPEIKVYTEYTDDNKTEANTNLYNIEYYKWDDKNSDNIINDDGTNELTKDTAHSDVGYYVVKVTATDTNNYTVASPLSSTASQLTLYTKYADGSEAATAATPVYRNDADTNAYNHIIYFKVKSGDPNLKSGDGIKVQYDKDGTPQDAPLKDSDYKTDKTFPPAEGADNDYYTYVPKDTTNVDIVVEPGDADFDGEITVTTPDGTEYPAAKGEDGKWKATVPADKLTHEGDDTIKVQSSTGEAPEENVEYDVHIKVLRDAKIELNPGNSPYGEIMRDDSITNKDAAKAAFDADNKFTSEYLPQGKSTEVYYSTEAWNGETDSSKNLDRDDTALFAFEYDGFTDPGFTTATDSLGRPVPAKDITRTIKVCVLPGQDMKVNITEEMYRTTSVTGEETYDVFTNEQLAGGASKVIQPDIYELTYSFYDDGLQDTHTEIRKVVILPMMGDTTLDGLISTGDLLPVRNQTFHIYTEMNDTVKDTTHDLYIYRVVDTTYDVLISTGDLLPIRNMTFNIPVASYYSKFIK